MWKKIIIFLVIIATSVVALAYYNPSFKHWLLQSSGKLQDKSIVYKWQDANGQWQVSNQPPPAGTPFTKQEYLHDSNVLPSITEPEQ
jgi:hypothetical protein